MWHVLTVDQSYKEFRYKPNQTHLNQIIKVLGYIKNYRHILEQTGTKLCMNVDFKEQD